MDEWTVGRVSADPAGAYAYICELERLAAENDRLASENARSQQRTIEGLMARLAPVGPPVPTITVRQIYEKFEAAKKSAPSWRVMRNRLRAFVLCFGDTQAMQLSVRKWAEYRERRKAGDLLLGRAISPVTINFDLDWAKAMLSWACNEEQGLLPLNPLQKAKRESVDSARETWLTEEDLEKLLARCGLVLTAFVLVAVDTGLRISEVLRIRRDRIRLVETEGGDTVGVVEFSKRQMKGKRSHVSGITPRGVAAIALLPKSDNPFLFPSPKKQGRAYGARHIARMFRKACEESGVDARAADGDVRIRAHDLRHSAASAATRRGGSLLQVQRMLAHSSPAITARYVHHDEGGVVALATLMEAGAKKERARAKRLETQRAPTVGSGRATAESQMAATA